MTCQSPIVVALDYPTMAQSIEMAKRLDPSQCRVKVGKELFTTAGPVILDELHKLGFDETWAALLQMTSLFSCCYFR